MNIMDSFFRISMIAIAPCFIFIVICLVGLLWWLMFDICRDIVTSIVNLFETKYWIYQKHKRPRKWVKHIRILHDKLWDKGEKDIYGKLSAIIDEDN